MRRLIALQLRLTAICLLLMVVIDAALGSRAEFVNAWSVVERILGREPAAGNSWVATTWGQTSELLIVLLAASMIAAAIAVALVQLGLAGPARRPGSDPDK